MWLYEGIFQTIRNGWICMIVFGEPYNVGMKTSLLFRRGHSGFHVERERKLLRNAGAEHAA